MRLQVINRVLSCVYPTKKKNLPRPTKRDDPSLIRRGKKQPAKISEAAALSPLPRGTRPNLPVLLCPAVLWRDLSGRRGLVPLVRGKRGHFLTMALICLFGLTSCQKVIDVDLNSTEPRIVIEGTISDQQGPYSVKLSQTVNFDETNSFPPVTGAAVRISDNVGNSETLLETVPGTYTTSSLRGVPGRTYMLLVAVDGKEYTAISTMPSPVTIDKLKVEKLPFHGETIISVQFQDIAGVSNYFRFVEVLNGVQQKDIFLTDDRLQDGSAIISTLIGSRRNNNDDDEGLEAGDTVDVFLQCIDEDVYEFFRSADNAIGQSPSPSNPRTNLSNGALGYFSAYAARSKTIIIP